MFRSHNINKKNIKNQYSITTTDHTSDNIFTTTISNQNDNDLNISSTSLYLNNQKFPASDGSNSQLLSTNGNGVLSWIDSVNLAHIDIVSDDSPELGGNLSLNNNDITGTGNINITGSIQSSSSITCSDLTVNGSTTHINTSTLTVDDPLIYLGENNNGNTLDLGWYGKYNDGSVKYSGVIRDATDGKFKFFTSSVIAPAPHLTHFFSLIHSIEFILSREITISLLAAVAPPQSPVLPPDITNACLSSFAIFKIFFKSDSLSGKIIAVGSGVMALYQSPPYFSKYSLVVFT